MSNNLLNARSDEQGGEAEQLPPAEAEHVCICPPSEVSMEGALASFALGLLSEEEMKAVGAHILVCPACILKFYQLRASLDAVRRRGVIPCGDDLLQVSDLEATLDALENEAVPDIPHEFEEAADGDVEYECSLAATAGAYRAPSRRKFRGVRRLAAALLMFTALAKLYQTYVAPHPPDAGHNKAKLEQPTTAMTTSPPNATPPTTAAPPPNASRAMTASATTAPAVTSSATAGHASRVSPPAFARESLQGSPAHEVAHGVDGGIFVSGVAVKRVAVRRANAPAAAGGALAGASSPSDLRGASCVLPPAPPAGQTAWAATPRALKVKAAAAAGGNKRREVARAGGRQQLIPIYVKVFVKDDKPLQKVILSSFVAALKREGYFKVLTDAPGKKIPDDVYEVSLDFDRDADCFGTLFARLYDPTSTQIWDAEKSCHSYPKREMLMLTSKELVGNMVTLIKEHESGA